MGQVILVTPVIPPACPHLQQLPHRNLVGDLLRKDVQIFPDGVINGQLSFLHKLTNGDGGEQLVDGAEVEFGIQSVPHLELF